MNILSAPRLEYFKRDDCFICSGPANPTSWVKIGTLFQRNVEVFQFVQTCRMCEQFEQAMIEAEIEGRRYTAVELERCICGRAIHSSLNFCVSCWRQRRMIAKELRELKLTRDVMRELKRRARGKSTAAEPRGNV